MKKGIIILSALVAAWVVPTTSAGNAPDDRPGLRAAGGDLSSLYGGDVVGRYVARIVGERAMRRNAPASPSPDDRPGWRGAQPTSTSVYGDDFVGRWAAVHGNDVVSPDDRAFPRAVPSSDSAPLTPISAPSAAPGFDWGDAVIGALAAFAVALLLVALTLIGLYGRSRRGRLVLTS
jgi:hypothetical protein